MGKYHLLRISIKLSVGRKCREHCEHQGWTVNSHNMVAKQRPPEGLWRGEKSRRARASVWKSGENRNWAPPWKVPCAQLRYFEFCSLNDRVKNGRGSGNDPKNQSLTLGKRLHCVDIDNVYRKCPTQLSSLWRRLPCRRCSTEINLWVSLIQLYIINPAPLFICV